jgi:amino acid transporter
MTTATLRSTSAPADAEGGRLSGQLGPWSIVFMVVAAAGPLTAVAGTFPIGIAAGNGASFPASYVVCTVILVVFAFGFTAMARHVAEGGAFASYIARGMGRPAGTGAAFLALATYLLILLALVAFAGVAINGVIVGHIGPDIPWWVCSFVVLGVVAVLGYRHIALSGKVLGALMLAELAIVLALDVGIVGRGGSDEGFATAAFSPSSFFDGAPGIALLFAVTGFIGFEATAVFRNEARNPDRTIPTATFAALLLIGAFYAFSSWALVSAWGDKGAVARAQEDPATMVSATGVDVLGSTGGTIIEVLICTSVFAAVLSFHNVISRYLFTQGSNVLPSALARSHAGHSSPHVASVTTTSLSIALLVGSLAFGLDPILEIFTWFAGVGVMGVMALMLSTSISAFIFFRRHAGLTDAFHGRVAPVLGAVGVGWLLWMSIDNLTLLVGGSSTVAWSLSGVLVATFVIGALAALRTPGPAAPVADPIAP